MDQHVIFVGLDVHKATIALAVARGGRSSEVRFQGSLPHRPGALPDFARRLLSKHPGRRLSFCYEAGACGYGLARELTASPIVWSHKLLIAPSCLHPPQASRPAAVGCHPTSQVCGSSLAVAQARAGAHQGRPRPSQDGLGSRWAASTARPGRRRSLPCAAPPGAHGPRASTRPVSGGDRVRPLHG